MWQEMIAGIQQRAEESKTIDERDYMEDGLLHCWKCHKAKEVIVPFPWGDMKCAAKCDCEMGALKREDEARQLRLRAEKIERLRAKGFQDPAMRAVRFSMDDGSAPDTMKKMRAYANKWKQMRDENRGLLLFGGVGTGKTFAAACIANELIDRNVPCVMTSFPRIVNALQGTWDNRQQYLDDLNDCDLLVIDDFAVERQSEFVQEIIYQVIDSRYKVGFPLIVTTNLTAQELKNPGDVSKSRIYSRLLEMCHPIEFKGVDRRRRAVVNDYAKMEALLTEE